MRKIQKISIVGGTVGVLMAGGIAYAAWTSEGTGTGTAKAGSETVLQVEGNDIGDLYPTGSFPATVKVTNPGSYRITLTKIDFTGATADPGHSGCNASSVDVADLDLADNIAAGGSVTKDVTVTMSNDANESCEGATFTLNYTATGTSS